jgi:hypothetical protein
MNELARRKTQIECRALTNLGAAADGADRIGA